MFTGVFSDISRNQPIKRVGSLDSIFHRSPPKSFAIEVADALCCRAKALGSSHPSVVTGKHKKLMEGLMNVAEAIRKDSPVCIEQIVTTPPISQILLPFNTENVASEAFWAEAIEAHNAKAAITHGAIESSVPAVTDDDVKDAIVKTNAFIEGLDILNTKENQVNGSKENDAQCMESATNIENPGTSAFGDVANESNSIHLRLALDYSDAINLSWARNNIKPEENQSVSPQAQNQRKPRKTNKSRLRKRVTKASLIHFFQRRLKKAKSERKMKDQMSTLINTDRLKDLRKNFRNAWSTTKKTTQRKFIQLKKSLFKSHKN